MVTLGVRGGFLEEVALWWFRWESVNFRMRGNTSSMNYNCRGKRGQWGSVALSEC